MKRQFTHSGKWRFWALSLLIVISMTLTGSVQSYVPAQPQTDEPFDTISLPLEASSVISLTNTKPGVSKDPKLDSVMTDLVVAARVSDQAALALAWSRRLRLLDNRVHVQIVTDGKALQQVIQVVNAAGGEVTGASSDAGLIQGWLPIGSLEVVARNKNVYRVRQPVELVEMEEVAVGSSTTEGLAVINGPSWHSAGYTGSGVKVGIIDGGFLGYTSLLGSDLPESVIVKNFVDGETDGQVDGDSEHGTACAEIIYDIAPDATLYLAKIGTNLDLQEAVAWLKDTIQVDVISTSLGWYNQTPGDGTGEFADLVQSARDAGILWVTAAGNDRQAHWGGAYSDSDANDTHNFNGTQEVNYFGPGDGNAYSIPSGYVFQVALRWDDWTNVNQDYDLYLLRWNGASWEDIAYSWDVQDGSPGQTPTEFASVITSGSATAYGFVIQKWSSDRAVNFEVFAPKLARLDEVVYARSLANLADSPGAITAAALDVNSPFPQESYSSEGPTNGTGGTAAGGFNKPDISGFANVSTQSYGPGVFNGTSSATPHVAGAAALVLSAFPSFSPAQIQSYLQEQAVDMGSAGLDPVYGYGRLLLGDPPAGDPTITNIIPHSGINTGTVHVTITGSNFVEGASVKLTRSGQPDINATNVVVSSATTITADLDLTAALTGLWNVVVTNPDESSDTLIDGFEITDLTASLYLPLVLKNYPITPAPPVLNSIENSDGNGSYTVSWSASTNADRYTLQEDDNAGFTSPTEIYTGSNLFSAVNGKDIGTYYYRVKASASFLDSAWSNIQHVHVTVVPQPGDWTIVTIPGDSPQGEYSSIVLDSGGYPNISFMNDINVKFTRWNGSSWVSETVDTLDVYSSPNTSLALNSENKGLIAYPYNNPLYLGLSTWSGTAWNKTYFNVSASIEYAQIALKSDDEPCLSYRVKRTNAYYSFDYNIEMVCRTGGDWPSTPTIITTNANYGLLEYLKARFFSMVLDSLNRPHISFTRGVSSHELRYNGPDQDAYSSVVVDDSTNVGFFSSLALDSLEYPQISYYDYANGDLKYARWNGESWLVETVDSGGDVGRFTSMALDGEDHAHISYYDLSNGDLKYAHWDGSQWNIETVDGTGDVGSTTSLVVDALGYPHISYYDVTNGRLKYVTTSGVLSP